MTNKRPAITEEQRHRLAQRLSMMSHDRSDVGQALPRTARALAVGEGSDAGRTRLEALVDALVFERVIVPIDVEPDPRVTGIHAGENGHSPIDFVRERTPAGEALAVYSSAAHLAAHRGGDRPMALDFRTIALAALVETGGRVIMNPAPSSCLDRPWLPSPRGTSGCPPGAMRICVRSFLPMDGAHAPRSWTCRSNTRVMDSRASP